LGKVIKRSLIACGDKRGHAEARSSEKNMTQVYVCSIFSKALQLLKFLVLKIP
jgi:hypothetical protein